MTMLMTIVMASAVIPALSPGQPMPTLKGEFLTGTTAVLPDAASGRVALVAMGFTYEPRFAVEAWVGRFRKDFGDRPQMTFFEVPMIGGMAQLGKWFIDRGMRSGTPRADHEHVVTVYGGTIPWKQRLGFDAPDAAYLVLVDQRGVVRWRHNGLFAEQPYADLARQAADLLGEAEEASAKP